MIHVNKGVDVDTEQFREDLHDLAEGINERHYITSISIENSVHAEGRESVKLTIEMNPRDVSRFSAYRIPFEE